METKSRYEVVSDLEQKKRDLIRNRDELEFEVKTKERVILTKERQFQDMKKKQMVYIKF